MGSVADIREHDALSQMDGDGSGSIGTYGIGISHDPDMGNLPTRSIRASRTVNNRVGGKDNQQESGPQQGESYRESRCLSPRFSMCCIDGTHTRSTGTVTAITVPPGTRHPVGQPDAVPTNLPHTRKEVSGRPELYRRLRKDACRRWQGRDAGAALKVGSFPAPVTT